MPQKLATMSMQRRRLRHEKSLDSAPRESHRRTRLASEMISIGKYSTHLRLTKMTVTMVKTKRSLVCHSLSRARLRVSLTMLKFPCFCFMSRRLLNYRTFLSVMKPSKHKQQQGIRTEISTDSASLRSSLTLDLRPARSVCRLVRMSFSWEESPSLRRYRSTTRF